MTIVGKSKRSPSFRRNRWMLSAILLIIWVYTALPLFYVVVSASKSNNDLFTTFGLWFASDFKLFANIQQVFSFQDGIFARWLLNTIVYATTAGIGAALFATMAGYALAKYEFLGKRLVFAIILGAVMIPQTALVVPLFLLMSKVGIVNTPWAVILPSLVYPPGVFLMRVYADDAIPNELLDAGRVDGAGELHIFFSLALRLLMPGFATVLILSFVATWNNYFLPLVVLSSAEYFPVTVGLAQWYATATVGSGGGAALFTLVLAGALISIVPVIIAFIVMQRFWQGGLGAGGVKA
ncbi:carbohydrate ABC transporter permease [Rhizobium sp. P38BS-XIX]|uniref:carbohydrate ABC transporter permease n=1 Tax=Rhizobium sp. P38BS-XIX TaxID=2726740 RepID=UPI001980CD8C|nr:carbohydrate ABC transporter permease [Rhizobium sp. P38BS-XIX]